MEPILAARTFWEVLIILVLTLAIYNEDKFIIFEMNLERIIRRKIRMHKRAKAMKKKAAQKKTVHKTVEQEMIPQRPTTELRLFNVDEENVRGRRENVA